MWLIIRNPTVSRPRSLRQGEVLLGGVRLGAVRGDPADGAAVVLGLQDVVLGADAGQHQERDPGLLRGLGRDLDQLLLGGVREAVVEARPAEAVTVGHLEDGHPRVVERGDHRAHLVGGELVALVVRAVAQAGVGQADVEVFAPRPLEDVQLGVSVNGHVSSSSVCGFETLAALVPQPPVAIPSPARVAAAVMMSRFPEYGGRKSPAPSTSMKTLTLVWPRVACVGGSNCGSCSSR